MTTNGRLLRKGFIMLQLIADCKCDWNLPISTIDKIFLSGLDISHGSWAEIALPTDIRNLVRDGKLFGIEWSLRAYVGHSQ